MPSPNHSASAHPLRPHNKHRASSSISDHLSIKRLLATPAGERSPLKAAFGLGGKQNEAMHRAGKRESEAAPSRLPVDGTHGVPHVLGCVVLAHYVYPSALGSTDSCTQPSARSDLDGFSIPCALTHYVQCASAVTARYALAYNVECALTLSYSASRASHEESRPSTATNNAEEQRPSTPPTPIGITGGTFGFHNSPTKRKPVLKEVADKGKGRMVEDEDDVVIAIASEGRVCCSHSAGVPLAHRLFAGFRSILALASLELSDDSAGRHVTSGGFAGYEFLKANAPPALVFFLTTVCALILPCAQINNTASIQRKLATPRCVDQPSADDKRGRRTGRLVATATAGHEFVITSPVGATGDGFSRPAKAEDADVEGIADAPADIRFKCVSDTLTDWQHVDIPVFEDEPVCSITRAAWRAVVSVFNTVNIVSTALTQLGVLAYAASSLMRARSASSVSSASKEAQPAPPVPDSDPRWMSESDARRMNETDGRRALEGETPSLGVRGQQLLRSPDNSTHASRAPSPLSRSASASVVSLAQSGPDRDRDVKPPLSSTPPASALLQRGRGPHASGGGIEVSSRLRAARDVDLKSATPTMSASTTGSSALPSPRHASLAPYPSSTSTASDVEAPPRPKKSVRRTASMTLPSLLLHKPSMPAALSPSLPSGLFTPKRDKGSSSSGSPTTQEASCTTSLPGTPGTPSSGAGTPSTPSRSGLFGFGRSFGFGRRGKDELEAERERERERERELTQAKERERERDNDKRRPNVLRRRSSATRSALGAEIRVDSPEEPLKLERIDSSNAEEELANEAAKEPAPIFGVPIDPRRGLVDEDPGEQEGETPPRKAPIYESFRRREATQEAQRQSTLSPPPMSPPQSFRSLHRSPSSPMMMLNPWSPPSPQAPLPEPRHASSKSAGALSEMSRASSGMDASPRPSLSSESRRSFSREVHKRGHTPAVPSSSTFGPFGTLASFGTGEAEDLPSRGRRDTGTSDGSRSTAIYTSDGRRDSEWEESRRNTTFTIDDKLDNDVWRKTPTLSDRLSLTLESYYVTPPSASTTNEQDTLPDSKLADEVDRPETPTRKLARRPSMLNVNIESPEISMEGAFDTIESHPLQSTSAAPDTEPPPLARADASQSTSLEQPRPAPAALTIQPSFRRARAADGETLLIPPRESVATLSPSSASDGQPFTPVHNVNGEGFDMIARLASEDGAETMVANSPRERRGTVAGVQIEVSVGAEAREAPATHARSIHDASSNSPSYAQQDQAGADTSSPLNRGTVPKSDEQEGSSHLPYFTVFGSVSPVASSSSAFVTTAFGSKGSDPTSPNGSMSKRRPSSPSARPGHGTSKSFSERGLARKLSTRYLRAHDDIDTGSKSSTATPEKEHSKSRSASYEDQEGRKSGERQRAQLTKRNRKSEPPGALLSAAEGSSPSASPGSGGSRIWRLVKRISTGALREKVDWDDESVKAPPVPAIPNHLREGSAFIGGPRPSDETRSTKVKSRPLPVNRPGNSSPEVESSVDDKFFAGTRRSSVSSVDPIDAVGKPILPPSELGRIAREMEAERQSGRERSKSSTSSNSMRSAAASSTRTRSSSGRGPGHARTDTEFTIVATSPSEELTGLTAPPPRRRKDDDLAEFGAAAAASPMIPSFSIDQPINAFNKGKTHAPSRSSPRNMSLPSTSDGSPSLPPPRSKTRPSLQETRETGRLQSPHAHSFSTSALKRSKAPPVTFRPLGSSSAASRALSEKEKAARWDDLLLMSERAGGTIHLGSEGLPSDQLRFSTTSSSLDALVNAED
ncbi:hypothetical protein HDZ31DRAFT_63030 [Schizophyllum fasciatum]